MDPSGSLHSIAGFVLDQHPFVLNAIALRTDQRTSITYVYSLRTKVSIYVIDGLRFVLNAQTFVLNAQTFVLNIRAFVLNAQTFVLNVPTFAIFPVQLLIRPAHHLLNNAKNLRILLSQH
ncbi:MAG: hypothetical protein KME43_17385 [Myxacorys chilensis ATA2-1-KO14]|jgi:hypothetical protein|nr:hypothetical protein [Myxacorys chilensis ATA2-1-KO14]